MARNDEGHEEIVKKDRTKNKSSFRTLRLSPQVEAVLRKKQEDIKMYQKVCGKCYCKEYLNYICVDELGKLLNPNYVSNRFKLLLKKHNLPKITFHQLRHSCVGLLIEMGVPMKEIQLLVGHSSYNTTANIYGKMVKLDMAQSLNAMDSALNLVGGSN